MRTFYVYYINDFFSSMYREYPHQLYKLLEEAYYMNRQPKAAGANYYEQINLNFNKLYMDNFLAVNHKLDVYYHNKNHVHLISSGEEYSRLMVSKYCLKIKSNLSYPKFFATLVKFHSNLFICDFEAQDYFWLSQVKLPEMIGKS